MITDKYCKDHNKMTTIVIKNTSALAVITKDDLYDSIFYNHIFNTFKRMANGDNTLLDHIINEFKNVIEYNIPGNNILVCSNDKFKTIIVSDPNISITSPGFLPNDFYVFRPINYCLYESENSGESKILVAVDKYDVDFGDQ